MSPESTHTKLETSAKATPTAETGGVSTTNSPPTTRRPLSPAGLESIAATSGASSRAQLATSLQRTAGNARVGRLFNASVQAKLTVNAPGDIYEQEADRVADQVMRMAQPVGDGQADQPPATIHRQAQPGDIPEVTPQVESHIQAAKGGGERLAESARAFAEPRFGQDFGGVRVHTDAPANQTARALNAQAFTSGQDIYFGAGHYQPGTPHGDRLLAHELTHVVQQSAAALPAEPVIRRNSGATPSNLQKLDQLLDQFDVPEEEVIALLGRLAPDEKKAVLSGGYQARIANALNVGEMIRAVTNLNPELATKLRWVESAATARSQIDYADIRAMIIAPLQPERDDLKTNRWRDFFVDVCTNETMALAVRDLGFDLKTKLEWMQAEGSNWSLVKDQIMNTIDAKEKVVLYDSPQMKEFFVEICNDVEMAEAVVLLGGTEEQQRQWMDAEGADWVLVLARLQYEHLEAERRQKEEQQRKVAEEAAKKRGETKPVEAPKVTMGQIVGEEIEKGKLFTSPTSAWDKLPETQKEDWEKRRAPEAWEKLRDSVKETELGKVMKHVDYEFAPKMALEKSAYAWQRPGRLWGNTLGFGMKFVEDIEHDPKIVWSTVAHEMGGHVEYGKTYAGDIMEKALDLMPKDVRERWQKDKEARQQFFEAYKYPETEIFADLRALRYEVPLSGAKPKRPQARDPYENIPFQLTQIQARYHPEVARAILKELKRRVDESPEILDRDKKYLADQIKQAFGYVP